MKKAKVILTAIVLLGVAGGALAFKAIKGEKIYCTNVPGKTAGTEFCPTLNHWTLTQAGVITSYCTAVENFECVLTTIKEQQ